jgi:hypothetical protein
LDGATTLALTAFGAKEGLALEGEIRSFAASIGFESRVPELLARFQ